MTADHAHVGADRSDPSGAAVQLGRVADRTVFLPVGQVSAVDQALHRVLAVLIAQGGAEHHLVAFGQEVRAGSTVRAELGGQRVRVLRDGLPADPQIGEVAVFQQVDRVEQLARASRLSTATICPDGRRNSQIRAPVTVAACCQRLNLRALTSSASRHNTPGSWSADSR